MRVTDYTKAVVELVKNGMSPDTVLHGLREMLTARGHNELYPKILKALLQYSEEATTRDQITVTLGHEGDEVELKARIADAVARLRGTTYETKIDPTITGGFIASTHEKRIDQSYKKTLLTLYRSLIKPAL